MIIRVAMAATVTSLTRSWYMRFSARRSPAADPATSRPSDATGRSQRDVDAGGNDGATGLPYRRR